MQEKSQNLSGKQGEESMIWDKMVKSNLLISQEMIGPKTVSETKQSQGADISYCLVKHYYS